MPIPIAKETDLTSRSWSLDSLRDFMLGLRVADDAKYAERHHGVVAIISANDLRYEQIFRDRQHEVELALTAQQIQFNLALVGQKEAVDKAETASEKRFESVNEFRATLADQQRMLMPRAEVEVLIKSIHDKITGNSELIRNLTELVNQVNARRDGQHSGITAGWGGAVAIFGFVSLILSIIFKFIK